MLAVTVGQGADEGDPYTRLYAYDQVTLPFVAFSFGSRSVVQRVVVRDWVGYTGESFSGDGEIFVYVTPKGEVYHRSRDCRYLNVSIQSIAAGQLDAARNWDGSRYTACVYCVKKEKPGAMVYITNYGTNYHNRKTCRGLKRTVMAIPYSQTGGMRCCQGCGGS